MNRREARERARDIAFILCGEWPAAHNTPTQRIHRYAGEIAIIRHVAKSRRKPRRWLRSTDRAWCAAFIWSAPGSRRSSAADRLLSYAEDIFHERQNFRAKREQQKTRRPLFGDRP